MASPHRTRGIWAAVAACALGLAVAPSATAGGARHDDVLGPGTTFYVNPDSTTLEAAEHLTGQARADAELLAGYPSATWFTEGSPGQVKKEVHRLVRDAARADEVPVLVAYNLPFRDCSQYSAGGAKNPAQYRAWIRQLAHGIGRHEAVVILEPDGLGIIPWYTTINGELEWCQPADADPQTAAAERFAMLRYAVDVLSRLPRTAVYLDAGHSAWLGVGDAADRLRKAGVDRADGFFLNASNYQHTENLVQYGTWISQCLAFGTLSDCPNQYWNGGPEGTAIADLLGAWTGVALRHDGVWSPTSTDPTLNTSGIDAGYASRLGDTPPMAHFVIDTSRNGQGPWLAEPGEYADPEEWCNPPGRGLGIRPTTDTRNALVDAYLWIKVPGESDGQCLRGTQGPTDPERGMVDPPAGQWFAEQARELIELAVPPVG